MNRKVIAGLALALGVIVMWAVFARTDDADRMEKTSVAAIDTSENAPAYAWRFEEAETLNPDGGSQTRVILAVTSDGVRQEQLVDTVDGSCSELSGEEFAVQCYYAGFGERYRVIESEGSYVVERKYFEEALPNIPSAEYEWEAIASLRSN